MSVVLAGAVCCGGGPDTAYSSCRVAPMLSDLALCKIGLAAAVGSPSVVSPGPPGLAGDTGVGAFYGGGADLDPGTDAELGVEGRPCTLPAGVGVPCGGWVAGSWARDAGTATPDGGPMFGSPAGLVAVVVAFLLGRVGSKRSSG